MSNDNGSEIVTMREAFEHLLCRGGVRVALHGRAAGVELPEQIRDLDPLVLEYGLDLPTPIPDIEASDDGISATLSFSRTPYKTFIPWDAVIGMAPMRTESPAPAARERPKLKLV